MLLKKTWLFFIVAVNGFVSAQNTGIDQTKKDYLKFKETLQAELDNLEPDTNYSPGKYTLHPASLPEWFSGIPPSGENTIYTIGISDPGMGEEEAIQLAMLRAKCVAALLLNPRISSLADNFTDEREKGSKGGALASKYINYHRVIATLPATDDQFESIGLFITSFDEVIVLLKLRLADPDLQPKDTIETETDIYQAETQKHNYFEMEELWQMKGIYKPVLGKVTDDYEYSFKSVNNLSEISSSFNQEKLDYPYFNFRYQGNAGTGGSILENTVSGKLNLGIWKGFLESFLQNLILHGQDSPVNIKQVGEAYTSRTLNLSREVAELSCSFRIKNMQISSNKLFLYLEKLEKPNSN